MVSNRQPRRKKDVILSVVQFACFAAFLHKDVVYEKEKYPEDFTEPRIELNAAPATRLHMIDFLTRIAANRTVIGVFVEFHLFYVPVCVLQIFF